MSEIVGFTNGVFDLFHEGHRHLLREAAKGVDILIVAINSDASAKRLKGEIRPVHQLATRASNVMAFLDSLWPLKWIVHAMDSDTPEELIRGELPHVLIHGSDAPHPWPGEEFVRGYCGDIRVVQRIPGVSTTEILKGSM